MEIEDCIDEISYEAGYNEATANIKKIVELMHEGKLNLNNTKEFAKIGAPLLQASNQNNLSFMMGFVKGIDESCKIVELAQKMKGER